MCGGPQSLLPPDFAYWLASRRWGVWAECTHVKKGNKSQQVTLVQVSIVLVNSYEIRIVAFR